jgi:hypothetical protein
MSVALVIDPGLNIQIFHLERVALDELPAASTINLHFS